MRLTTALICGAIVALCATPARAQALVNPTTVVFTASPDHAKVLPDGTRAVTNYLLPVTLVGASGPVTSLDVVQLNGGTMPTPDAGNNITLVIPNAFRALGFGAYTVASQAMGPGGTSPVSAPSNPFDSVQSPGASGKPTVK